MRLTVRNPRPGDLPVLIDLQRMLGTEPAASLDDYHLHLCCDLFSRECWVLIEDDTIVGYLLSFPRGRESYCGALELMPGLGLGATRLLVEAWLESSSTRYVRGWFSLDNRLAASRLQSALVALRIEVETTDSGGRAVASFGVNDLDKKLATSAAERGESRTRRLPVLATATTPL